MARYTSYKTTKIVDDNYIHFREGDFVIAQSKDKNATIKILKGTVTVGDRTSNIGNIVTVRSYEYLQTFTVPTSLIIVHVPSIYPKFEELKAEMLTMDSEDGEDYKRLYNVYKMYDNAKYHIDDYIVTYYKTENDFTGKFRPCIVRELNVDDDGTICYTVTTVEDKTIQIHESDVYLYSSKEEYQRERQEYIRSKQTAAEVRIATHDASISNIETTIHDLEAVVSKLQGDLQVTSSISSANSGGEVTISDDVRFNRLDVLEEKHHKTQKLVKLGLSLILGGI